ncbi:MAG: 4Fe-4S dicluster domain-containing protein, partial [Pirellula sp.]|nr:4Fe-4S dicluster domain-containing protein [Pirellula sp.]
GNEGVCVHYTNEPLAELAPQGFVASIAKLGQMLQGNVIQTLFILGGNPVFDAPSDVTLRLESTEDRPLLSIHLSDAVNETSQHCTWHVPLAHSLESWSDGLSQSGTYTLGQPLIEPLFGGRSVIELLGLFGGDSQLDARTEIRRTFDQYFSSPGNPSWEVGLHDGCFGEPVLKRIASNKVAVPNDSLAHLTSLSSMGDETMELRLQSSASVYDGRFSNNPWLQELPDPISKLTWDNAAYISKVDADRWQLSDGSLIRLMDKVEIPVMIMPGQPEGCISGAVGYGRTNAGRVGNSVGSNLYELRTSTSGWPIQDCSFKKLGTHRDLATTQLHHVVRSVADIALKQRLGDKGESGLLIHEATLEEFRADSHNAHGDNHTIHKAPLFNGPNAFDTPHRWAMAIDLNACIGCSGCVVACQAENNIPVVGRDNVLANREMHWIRIDRYFKGDIKDPDMVHVPTACVHCENAPCEQVCPVAATVHDTEGINAMVYNRCIGTRYCANNCPYKVRRFNYFDFHASDPRVPAKPYLGIPDQQQVYEVSTLKKMVHNPDVSVRMRGVMEKCTYCVQRISSARIHAKNEHAQGLRSTDLVREGKVQTACQATCPTQAIVFGDLNDPDSEISRLRHNSRSYEMLAELNLGARTTYLAKVRNRTP